MRPPPKIRAWLSPPRLIAWVREAPSKAIYQRRWVISLATSRRFHAKEIGEVVLVSARSVRRWIHAYNEHGPCALDEEARGGRRWAYATEADEDRLLAPLKHQTERGHFLPVRQIRSHLEAALGHAVSPTYVYRLLRRHGWEKVVPRPRRRKADVISR